MGSTLALEQDHGCKTGHHNGLGLHNNIWHIVLEQSWFELGSEDNNFRNQTIFHKPGSGFGTFVVGNHLYDDYHNFEIVACPRWGLLGKERVFENSWCPAMSDYSLLGNYNPCDFQGNGNWDYSLECELGLGPAGC